MADNERVFNGIQINELGELVNAKTGEVIGNGNLRTGITIDSSAAEPKTIEEMGYSPLTETEEEYKEAMRRQGETVMRSTWEIIYEHEHPGRNAIDDFIERNALNAQEDGKRRFNARKSKYEVRPDTSFVIRFGIAEKPDGDGFYTMRAGDLKNDLSAEEHWVKFRMWTYEDKLKWKAECREFDASSKTMTINKDMLNERKIKHLLLDWSFAKYGDKMRLLHCDGALSNDSYSMFLGLYPTIANVIVDLMNSVLES